MSGLKESYTALSFQDTSAPVFEGQVDAMRRWCGAGSLVYADGTRFEGTFLDGQFHGPGRLFFPFGGSYCATWSCGRETAGTGAFCFDDGLLFQGRTTDAHAPGSEWLFLGGYDRRLWPEHLAGSPAKLQLKSAEKSTQTGNDSSASPASK